MVKTLRRHARLALVALLALAGTAAAQDVGSIRGQVYDKDFEAPLAEPEILVVELNRTVTGTEDGTFLITDLPVNVYTLIFSKPGYARQVKANVSVTNGGITELDVWLSGEFTEMDDFVVEELQIGGGTEAGLLRLRLDAPALMDSVSAQLISRAGYSDAASALRLVAGATVQEGKYAVVRGLPDRYVNSQLNGVRLPTADIDKRAVQLDQFPTAVIESIQVTKTFTPDQQGDASGGAVNVLLLGIPEETSFQFKAEIKYNTQVTGRHDFLSYDGGGINALGNDSRRDEPALGDPFHGAVGVSDNYDAPLDYKFSLSGGGSHEFDSGWRIGGFASFYYERFSSYYDDGVNDSYWIRDAGDPLTPQYVQGAPPDDFKTRLFDVTQGSQGVQWGGLGAFGVANEHHEVNVHYVYSRTTEDTATLSEDTRGKQYYFPGHDPDDQDTPGHDMLDAAPYLRLETLAYTERTTSSLQFSGRHEIPIDEFGIDDVFMFQEPVIDWLYAKSNAELYEPDKRQFGSYWQPGRIVPLPPPFPPFVVDPMYFPLKPAANFQIGNAQRIWKDIDESSDQFAVNLTLPFRQWTDDEGSIKAGVFSDTVKRSYEQESYSNLDDNAGSVGEWETSWSEYWLFEDHEFDPADIDVDYTGNQKIRAWYAMATLPIVSWLDVIGGARVESTDLQIRNFPDPGVTWYPPNSGETEIQPGDTDVNFSQTDVLPSIALVWSPSTEVTVRGVYAETVARQTFKELTPIVQQEYLGAPIFIGNPDLQMSALRNYDMRVDYAPYDGGLFSVSWFRKDIDDPIEYIQRNAGFTFTTPVNYPTGTITGWEIEVRQDIGQFADFLDGLQVGVNATFIESDVVLPLSESEAFLNDFGVDITSRDMTGAPDRLVNLYLTYDTEVTGTAIGLFYTITGDTLVAGAGQAAGNFVPDVYATEIDSLNFTITQNIGANLKLFFKAKNLTNPAVQTVYRTEDQGDVLKTSYTNGIEYSLGLTAQFNF